MKTIITTLFSLLILSGNGLMAQVTTAEDPINQDTPPIEIANDARMIEQQSKSMIYDNEGKKMHSMTQEDVDKRDALNQEMNLLENHSDLPLKSTSAEKEAAYKELYTLYMTLEKAGEDTTQVLQLIEQLLGHIPAELRMIDMVPSSNNN